MCLPVPLLITIYACSLCFFSMDSASTRYRFMKQINSSFGSGGMGLAMTEVEFSSFIIFLKSKSTQSHMPIRKAATVIGRQQCGKVWVMGKTLQVSVSCTQSNYTKQFPNQSLKSSQTTLTDLSLAVGMPICTFVSPHEKSLTRDFRISSSYSTFYLVNHLALNEHITPYSCVCVLHYIFPMLQCFSLVCFNSGLLLFRLMLMENR